MRPLRHSLLLILVLALILPPLAGLTPSAGAQQDADTITIGVTDLPNTLDPAVAYDFAAWEVLSHLYTGLTRQVPGTLDYELVLAESYTVSEDKLTYTFTLRDNIAFNDGTPITAQTFVDSLARVRTLDRDALQAVEPYIAGIDAPDERTLVYTLTRPLPYFLGLLALPPYFPVHPTLAATSTTQNYTDTLIGSGSYRLERFDVGNEIVLTANPDYAFGPPPATSTIVLRRFEKAVELRNALQAHAVDLAWRTLFLGHLIELENAGGWQIVEIPSTRVFYIVMGQNREPTDDPMVREAVTLLLNRERSVNEAFRGHISPLFSLLPDLYPEAYAEMWPAAPDVEYAEDVLLRAGYNEQGRYRLNLLITLPMQVYGVPYPTAAVYLARTSFDPTKFVVYNLFTDIELASFERMLEDGDSQLGIFAWTPIVPHPYATLWPLVHSSQKIPANNRYNAPGLDALLDDAAVLDDPAEQGAIYQEIAEWILDDHALIPVWQDHLYVAAWDDISGIQVEPNFFLHYDTLTRE